MIQLKMRRFGSFKQSNFREWVYAKRVYKLYA